MTTQKKNGRNGRIVSKKIQITNFVSIQALRANIKNQTTNKLTGGPMKVLSLIAMTVMLTAASFSTKAEAQSNPTYEMRGIDTYLYPQDVDYWSTPIKLVRTSETKFIHRLNFDVLTYERYCARYENRCVQYDQQGRCTRYEQVCVAYNYREYPVEKRIEIDFRNASVLTAEETEMYEINIDRQKPYDGGEDRVRTSLYADSTKAPVKILRMNDFSYRVDIKK